jgi:MFS family permease
MVLSPWLFVTVTLRRFTLFAIVFSGGATLLIPLTTDIDLLYALRSAQGLAGGLTIPLPMVRTLRFTPPALRARGVCLDGDGPPWSGGRARGVVDRDRRLALRVLRGRAAVRDSGDPGVLQPAAGPAAL